MCFSTSAGFACSGEFYSMTYLGISSVESLIQGTIKTDYPEYMKLWHRLWLSSLVSGVPFLSLSTSPSKIREEKAMEFWCVVILQLSGDKNYLC